MSGAATHLPASHNGRPLSRLSTTGRVWLFSAVLTLVGGGLLAVVIALLPQPVSDAVRIPWWALAILFYLAEAIVVHLQFRGEAHTFSLSEIPLVLGLFFVAPAEFVLANLVGGGLALAINRRQPPIKLFFNLSQFLLVATVAVVVFHAAQAQIFGPDPAHWLAALLATTTANIVGICVVASVIAVVEGRWQLEQLPQVAKFGLLVGFTNTCLALIAVTLFVRDPISLWLLALPAALLYAAYRAYASERQKHASLEFLYQATRILAGSRELDKAVSNLLSHAQRVFRAETAEMAFFAADGSAHGVRTEFAGRDGAGVAVERFSLTADDPLRRRALTESRPFLYTADGVAKPVVRGLRNAMVAPLRGESRDLGMILVANRLGDVGGFGAEDMRLFETLANQTATALENGQLGESLRHLAELKEKLQHQAYHDPLTGIGNRTLLMEELEGALAGGSGDGWPAVLFLDLDDFKAVNDSLGHAAGDELLKAVARRVRSALRPGDLAVRLGGDEFAVLLRGGPDRVQAERVAERVLARLDEPISAAGREIACHASIGVALGDEGITAEELVRDADVAMYSAKAAGKGRLAVFEPGMREAVVARQALKADLQGALERNEFVLQYQPIASLAAGAESGQLIGLEALIRWQHPARGVIAAVDFVSIAEEAGLMPEVGEWVLRQACRQARGWNRQRAGRPLSVHVNISARQLRQPRFAEMVADVLAESGLEPALLVLEITESLLMTDPRANVALLHALKQLGVRLAIDDFGSGWSTLAMLRDFPVDVLKMAKAFLEGRRAAETDWRFAQAVIGLGHSLGMAVVAEGVERADQLRRLRQLGCDAGQGYHFSPPIDEQRAMGLANSRSGRVRRQRVTGARLQITPASRSASTSAVL